LPKVEVALRHTAIIQIITSYMPKSCEKAGDFQMLGTLAELKVEEHSYKKPIADHIERFIFPEFSNCGQLQVRICWVMGCYHALDYDGLQLRKIIRHLKDCIISHHEGMLPLKVIIVISYLYR
jgi:hypothetical protein